jgi:uncharacterized protein with PIN domain
MSERSRERPAFIVDRMLGTLCRYLRFMGYDTLSANTLREGNRREDTLLLDLATRTGRILLTRDRNLAERGGARAVLVTGDDVIAQIRQLTRRGLIVPELRLTRCSLCNRMLRPATEEEIAGADYAPRNRRDLRFYWCRSCQKLYWLGSHGDNLEKRIKEGL